MLTFSNRRGAIAVLMVVLMTGLMLTAAAAVDISRMFTMQNELRTAAEAAALAGGHQLLKNPAWAADSAKAVGDANFVLDQPVYVAGEDIKFGTWDPNTRVFTQLVLPTSANAIWVRTRRLSNYLIAQLFGLDSIELRAEATVWAHAPVGETNCVKPWAVPYDSLTGKLIRALPDSADLTANDLLQLQSLRPAAVIKIGPQQGGGPPVPGNSYSVEIGGAGVYESNIKPPCEDVMVSPGDLLKLVNLDSLETVSAMNAVGLWCAQFGGSPCVAKVVLWSNVGPGPRVEVRMMSGFVIDSVVPPGGPGGGQAEVHGYFTILADNGGIEKSFKLTPLRRPILVQ